MTILETILAEYPELENSDYFVKSKIMIFDELDGQGECLIKWECDLPLPKGLKVGR